MSGIYIHIPFCKKACHYCNFHFSTSLSLKENMVEAICMEINIRKDYLGEKKLTSIYFGGGTPSLLGEKELIKIFQTIDSIYLRSSDTEITLEANPDDLDTSKIKMMKRIGINRLSIGVQSFFDEDLLWMNRAHNATEALRSIQLSQDIGLDNISIDLIYGSPTTTDEMWTKNLDTALNLQVPHISSYCMTVEEKTALHHQIKTGKSNDIDPVSSTRQFDMLIDRLRSSGYDHYEISNFALNKKFAIHNTNYWRGMPYIGIGPSAHSYNITTRSWNIAHNKKYIDTIQGGVLPIENEVLTLEMRYNEYIMTSLRTMWGVDVKEIEKFGSFYSSYFAEAIKKELNLGMVSRDFDKFVLTPKGKHFADRVAMNLFVALD